MTSFSQIRSRIPLFFQRRQIERGEIPSVFRFDLPEKAVKEIIPLWEDKEYIDAKKICQTLRFQLETPRLVYIGGYPFDVYPYHYEVEEFLLQEKNAEKKLTAIEMICNALIGQHKRTVRKINTILREEQIGYEYNLDTRMLISLEDDNFYSQCTEPFLSILSQAKYKKVLDYYISAYENLSLDYDTSALLQIGRAIKTLMHIRLTEYKIAHSPKDSFNRLIQLFQEHQAEPRQNIGYMKLLIQEIADTRLKLRPKNANIKKKSSTQLPKRDDPYIRFLMNQATAMLLFSAQVELSAR